MNIILKHIWGNTTKGRGKGCRRQNRKASLYDTQLTVTVLWNNYMICENDTIRRDISVLYNVVANLKNKTKSN